MRSAKKTVLIEDHEFHLEDIYEGLIALDRALKLVHRGGSDLPISTSQAINVNFYITGAIARDVERLASVKSELPPDAVAQLDQYTTRLRQRSKKVMKLKSRDDFNKRGVFLSQAFNE